MPTQLSIMIIVSLCAIALAGGVLLLIPLMKQSYYRHHLVKIFGKFIYHIALYSDYYLINNMSLRLDPDHTAHIDHILFGEKYIYVIKDKYYKGALSGKENDESWVFFPDDRRKSRYIDNPLKVNRVRTEKLGLFTGLDEDLFISIIVVNNDCLLEKFESFSRRDYVVQVGKLNKLIEAIESRSVPKINEQQLEQAVQDIAQINKGEGFE
jgi:hypothetical protein